MVYILHILLGNQILYDLFLYSSRPLLKYLKTLIYCTYLEHSVHWKYLAYHSNTQYLSKLHNHNGYHQVIPTRPMIRIIGPDKQTITFKLSVTPIHQMSPNWVAMLFSMQIPSDTPACQKLLCQAPYAEAISIDSVPLTPPSSYAYHDYSNQSLPL